MIVLRQSIVISLLSLYAMFSQASIEVVDIAGKKVSLKQPAKKVVLGEGRLISIFSVLGINEPVEYIAGMMNEFKKYDSASYNQYKKIYPKIDQIPTFGNTTEASVSVEKIILLKPDLAIFSLIGHGPGAKSKHIISRLEKAGIPIVFVDFRQKPLEHTAKSVEIVGRLLGKAEQAKQFAEHYQQQTQLVANRVKNIAPEDYPSVLIDIRADSSKPCCLTISRGLFAEMVKFAGGQSMAADLLPGPVGQLSYEHILSAGFDAYIGSAIGAVTKNNAYANFLLAGPNVSEEAARKSLQQMLKARKFDGLKAVKNGKAYALWHHFYNSPFNLYAVEVMAKWFHPERFKDLQPERTLQKYLQAAQPVDLQGRYSVSIDSLK